MKTEQLVLPNIMFVPEAATPHRVHMGLVMQHPWRWLWSKYCPNISLSQLTSCAQWHLQDHRFILAYWPIHEYVTEEGTKWQFKSYSNKIIVFTLAKLDNIRNTIVGQQ